MWKEKSYHLKSSCPLLMHNGQTADPLNKFARAMKEVSSKRGKTEADYEELAHIEFLASLYMGETGPILPATNIEAMLIAAAKKFKEGNQAKAGMYVKDNAPLVYDGPTNPEEMFLDDRFRDTRAVVIQRNRVMRTRAIFKRWEADVTVVYEDTVINESRVDEWMKTAGNIIGLLEMRPRLGRFEVV
jgi:hypothetical protein